MENYAINARISAKTQNYFKKFYVKAIYAYKGSNFKQNSKKFCGYFRNGNYLKLSTEIVDKLVYNLRDLLTYESKVELPIF